MTIKLNYIIAFGVIILLLLGFYYYKYSHWNNITIAPCHKCESYHVHQEHKDKKEAAEIMSEIVRRNNILIDHLKSKYIIQNFNPNLDNSKNGRIDIIPSSELQGIGRNVLRTEYVQDRVEQLIKNYNPQKIYEISPKNISGITSYTQDKKTLIFCLRKKTKNKNGEHELHDINTLMFVNIHELTHMMNDLWGHQSDFWILFKFMLENAIECGIYKPVDYSKYPIDYCGLLISYNPLVDPRLLF